MNMQFTSSVVLVTDIARSRKFYEGLLGQKIKMDNGEHIAYEGGFSIWEGAYAYGIIYSDSRKFPQNPVSETFELYFETEELDSIWEKVSKSGVNILHSVYEHPWGQRGFRITDPDGRIVEISEPLSIVVKRFRDEGMDIDEIVVRTSIPKEIVLKMGF